MTNQEVISQLRKNLREFITTNPLEFKQFQYEYGTCIQCDKPGCIRIENSNIRWDIMIEEDEYRPLVSINISWDTSPHKCLKWWRFETTDEKWISTSDNIATKLPSFPNEIMILMQKIFNLEFINDWVYGISFWIFKNT